MDGVKREIIFLTPSILGFVSLFVYFLLSNLKRIDPLRYAKTEDGMFKKFSLVMVIFMTGLSLIILFTSVHPEVPVNKLILSFLGVGFGLMGFYMPKLQQNYFAGFRLPWTLSSTANWDATHKMAGKWWVWGGMAQMIAAILFKEEILLIVFFAITAVIVLIPVIYSYQYFRKNGPQS